MSPGAGGQRAVGEGRLADEREELDAVRIDDGARARERVRCRRSSICI